MSPGDGRFELAARADGRKIKLAKGLSAEHHVQVSVDEARRDRSPRRINILIRVRIIVDRQDPSTFDRDGADPGQSRLCRPHHRVVNSQRRRHDQTV